MNSCKSEEAKIIDDCSEILRKEKNKLVEFIGIDAYGLLHEKDNYKLMNCYSMKVTGRKIYFTTQESKK